MLDHGAFFLEDLTLIESLLTRFTLIDNKLLEHQLMHVFVASFLIMVVYRLLLLVSLLDDSLAICQAFLLRVLVCRLDSFFKEAVELCICLIHNSLWHPCFAHLRPGSTEE